MSDISLNAVIAGQIYFETIINRSHKVNYDQPGGSALYAASGFIIWSKNGGILAKISEEKPLDWKFRYENAGLNTAGIIPIPESFDQRRFYAIQDNEEIETDNPQKHFFERGLALPKYLLGYTPAQSSREINRSAMANSISPDDIPRSYSRVPNLLVAPMDLYSHNMLPPFFRAQTHGNIIICGSASFMKPSFWYSFPTMVRGTSAFISTLSQLKQLFLGKSEDIWEMLLFVANCGVNIVCAFNPNGPHYLFDKQSGKKYEIGHYQSINIDPIGEYATFCGGFFGGYIKHFDPVLALKMGAISASLKQEGSTPQYVMGVMPELARVRLESMHNNVKLI